MKRNFLSQSTVHKTLWGIATKGTKMHEFFVKLRDLRGKRLIANNVYIRLLMGLALAACVAPPSRTPAPTSAPSVPTHSPAAVANPVSAGPQTLTVMTHDSFSVSEAVLKTFEQANNAKVVVLKSGDAGSALNKAILSKSAPIADVLYGVDNTFLSRALAANLFEAYAAPALANIPDSLKLDQENRLLPVDFGHVAINFDKAMGATPANLRELTDPKWKSKLVVQNPATSSPGLAFLLATIAAFPEGSGAPSAYDWKQFCPWFGRPRTVNAPGHATNRHSPESADRTSAKAGSARYPGRNRSILH